MEITTQNKAKEYRTLLENERTDVASQLRDLSHRSRILHSEVEKDPMDLALEDQQEMALYSLDLRQVTRMREVQAALERLENGTYGICRGCGGEIPEQRLRVLPTASLCLDCQERSERGMPLPAMASEDVEEELGNEHFGDMDDRHWSQLATATEDNEGAMRGTFHAGAKGWAPGDWDWASGDPSAATDDLDERWLHASDAESRERKKNARRSKDPYSERERGAHAERRRSKVGRRRSDEDRD